MSVIHTTQLSKETVEAIKEDYEKVAKEHRRILHKKRSY